MACLLLGAMPLPELMLKFETEFYNFHSRKCIWKCRLPKWRPFWLGGDELIIGAISRNSAVVKIKLTAVKVFCTNDHATQKTHDLVWLIKWHIVKYTYALFN